MGHKRLKLELIPKKQTRMNTFRKRKDNLLKKAYEFSVLCDVEACAIIYPPRHGNDQHVMAETWPLEQDRVINTINRYKESHQPRRSYKVSDYFADKKKKVDGELAKLRRQVCEVKYSTWDDRLNNLSEHELIALVGHLEAKIHVASEKLDLFKRSNENVGYTRKLEPNSKQPKPIEALPPAPYLQPAHGHFTELVSIEAQPPAACHLQPAPGGFTDLLNQVLMMGNNGQYPSNCQLSQMEPNLKPMNVQYPINHQYHHPVSIQNPTMNTSDPFGQYVPQNNLTFIKSSPWMTTNDTYWNGNYTPLPVLPVMQDNAAEDAGSLFEITSSPKYELNAYLLYQHKQQKPM